MIKLILNTLISLYHCIPLATCFHSFVHSEPKSRIFCATDVGFCCLAYATLEELIYFHYYEDIWMGVANTKHSLKNNYIWNKFSNNPSDHTYQTSSANRTFSHCSIAYTVQDSVVSFPHKTSTRVEARGRNLSLWFSWTLWTPVNFYAMCCGMMMHLQHVMYTIYTTSMYRKQKILQLLITRAQIFM
jgi:hypothetical protein